MCTSIKEYQIKHMLEKQKKKIQENNEGWKAHRPQGEEHLCWQNKLQVQRIFNAAQQGTAVRLSQHTSAQGAWKHEHSIVFAWLYTHFTEYFQSMNQPSMNFKTYIHLYGWNSVINTKGLGALLFPILLLQTRAREAGCKTALKQRIVWNSV